MSYPAIKASSEGVGGMLRVLGISGVKKVGCGCCAGVKWYVEGGARGREWRDSGEDLAGRRWKVVSLGRGGETRTEEEMRWKT